MGSTSLESDDALDARKLLAHLPGMAYCASANSTRALHYVSEGVLGLTGHTAEALTSGRTTWPALVHPDDKATVEHEVESALQERRGFSLVHRIVHASGSVRWVMDRCELVDGDDRGQLAFEGFVSDVTRMRREDEIRRNRDAEDISDRARTEAALRETEEWLRLAQAAGGVGLFDWNLAAGEARCSSHLFEVIGRAHPPHGRVRVEEATGWIHADDLERVTRDIGRALAGSDTSVSSNLRLVGEDGEYRWISYQAEIHRDPEGRATRMLGAVQDVTALERSAQQLQYAHERLSLALRAGHAGLWDWDLTQPHAYISPEYRDLYGLGADDPFSYASWLERVVDPRDRERVEAYGREVFAHGTEYVIEFRINHPTRGPRWLGSLGMVYRDAEGRAQRFTGINLDITELKGAEQARRESEERFRKVFEHAPTGIAITDVRGRFQQSNPAYSALLGYSEQELQQLEFPTLIHPEDRAANMVEIRRLLAGEVPSFETENRYVRKDGVEIWVHKLVSVLRDERGEPEHLIALVTDTTARHRAEWQLREADRHKDEFLATLAHELRNPLAPLRTGFEVMKRSRDRATRERAREMMERQLHHMVRLVDDLLDVARISRGQLELKRELVPLQVVVQHAVEIASPLIEARQHVLSTHVPDPPIWVDGDLTRLAQVVGNLLNNASKYTPKGGHIELELAVEEGRAVLRVSDDGMGIPPQLVPTVFDLFAQAAREGDRSQDGLGIGLYLARRLVQLHGGTITAQSPGVDRGSTFTIEFPLQAGPRVADRGRSHAPHEKTKRLRILVVDDNEEAAELLATLLGLQGHETRIAHDGPSALEVASAFVPDVAFLDIGLPGMNGHELARLFRADATLAGTLLVALTGWGADEDRRRAREAGFDHHLTKPASAAAIESVLARR